MARMQGNDPTADEPWLRLANPPRVDGRAHVERLPDDVGMPYTPLTKRALSLSFAVHKDQLDKSGMPYVYHPFHLADQMRTEEAACVALLHDTVEDGDIQLDDLRRLGFPTSVVDAVAALTHDTAVPYLDYVLGLRNNPLAREVKLADLRHNSNLSRLAKVRPSDRRRRIKYLMAQALLDHRADRFDPDLNPPVWRKRIPLDDERLYCLSLFYTTEGEVLRCSLDVESASDEHYQFEASELPALQHALDPQAPSFLAALCGVVLTQGPSAVLRILRTCGMSYQAFCY